MRFMVGARGGGQRKNQSPGPPACPEVGVLAGMAHLSPRAREPWQELSRTVRVWPAFAAGGALNGTGLQGREGEEGHAHGGHA